MTGRHEVQRLRRNLDNAFGRVLEVGDDLELKSDLSRYLYVLVAGFVEKSVVALIMSHCHRQSSPSIQRYVEVSLSRFSNVNKERLTQLLGSFNPDWRDEVSDFVIDALEASLNSVVAIRHQIAHGESSGISYARMVEYYNNIQVIMDYLCELIDPTG